MKLNNPENQIANTLGGLVYDLRFEEREAGPYQSADFADDLTTYLEKQRQEVPLSALYKDNMKICFTHSDLHKTNIFVQRGRLSCIIDWEHAGFKPEYWEYSKVLWPYLGSEEQKRIFAETFLDEDGCAKYQDELDGEIYLWKTKPVY